MILDRSLPIRSRSKDLRYSRAWQSSSAKTRPESSVRKAGVTSSSFQTSRSGRATWPIWLLPAHASITTLRCSGRNPQVQAYARADRSVTLRYRVRAVAEWSNLCGGSRYECALSRGAERCFNQVVRCERTNVQPLSQTSAWPSATIAMKTSSPAAARRRNMAA